MLTVLNCVVQDHDLRLVVLAAIICALASVAAMSLLHHVGKSSRSQKWAWLAVAAVATGFGIWATHFIAMLAFSQSVGSGYDVALTGLSLVAAIALTASGFAFALSRTIPAAPWIGGAVVGGGIATMHFTGMAAYQVAGWLHWDTTLVVASIVLGTVLGAIALAAGLRANTTKWKLLGALLLTLAICSLHFTAMGAVSIAPDPSIEVSQTALPAAWLAIAVAVASFAVILLALAGLALDIRDRRRAEIEADRMRGLANAAVEGLVICDGEMIVTCNNSFAALAGRPAEALIGRPLSLCFPEEATRLKLVTRSDQPVESLLARASGESTPVELILRHIDYAGRPHVVIAVRDLRARKKAESHINFLAHHDALTGLPNRTSFNKKLDLEMEKARTEGRRIAVLCLDLDRFKEVNDLFGHAAGDTLLQNVAKRITAVLDTDHMAARLGGDEFAIVVPNVANPTAAGLLAETVLEALRVESEVAEIASASIGVALFPDDADDRETLLNHADTALYRAKSEGRGTYRFFEASMGLQVRDRRMLEHDLRHAISRRELHLVFQPQSSVESGQVVGFEALLRWKHATRGSISPAMFIPVAEESGSILQIGEWVLRTACREAASWQQPLTVAINVSAVQIHNAGFVQLVHEILLETGLSPQRLELEITETALIRDLHRALATLRQLKALGIRIAMDDFGTGYSSLSNLRAFPFDKIKIDGSFIKAVDTNEQTAIIVRAVLGLGRGLGLPVLAEGVETSGELGFLAREACDEAQGYLLGKPAEIAAFRSYTHDVDSTAKNGHESDSQSATMRDVA